MKKTPKIGPLTVWIVGHTQNPLIAEASIIRALAVFYKKKDAIAYRKANATLFRVFKATIIRDGSGPDYKALRDDAESALAMERIAIKNLTEALAATQTELETLQKKIHDGKIWNVENARITPRAQAAIALASKEAEKAGATYIGTEHLLLGLLKQEEGIAHRHFIASGMTYGKAEYAMRVGRVS